MYHIIRNAGFGWHIICKCPNRQYAEEIEAALTKAYPNTKFMTVEEE